MVPSDYRLDEVSARLIERLEAVRPSFSDPDEAAIAFRRAAEEHVARAIGEYEEMMRGDRGVARQSALLREQILETFLPRYTRLAAERTATEAAGHGLGVLARPIGRVILGTIGLFGLFVMLRFISRPYTWPIDLLLIALPLIPDFVRAFAHRSHVRALQRIVDDMQRIQQQATAYLPATELSAETPNNAPRARPREGEWRD